MHELISNPGLRFELFELRGTLTYTFTRDDKPAKQYTLSESDFDIAHGEDDDEDRSTGTRPRTSGIEISAVGIRLQLLKNEGLLQMTFEGNEGSYADWVFGGSDAGNGKHFAASASTQTQLDTDLCSTCTGRLNVAASMQDADTQTETPSLQNFGTQMSVAHGVVASFAAEAGVPVVDARVGAQHTTTDVSSAVAVTNSTTINQALKRRSPPDPHTDRSIYKLVKSLHNFPLPPRKIYMHCQREHPSRKGDIGQLIIDLQAGEVWYNELYGPSDRQVEEKRQVNLSHESTRVSYHLNNPLYPTTSRHGPTHNLSISRRLKDGRYSLIANFRCAAPGWRIWFETARHRFIDTNPECIVDAIVRCVDRATGRDKAYGPGLEGGSQAGTLGDGEEAARKLREKDMFKVYKPDEPAPDDSK